MKKVAYLMIAAGFLVAAYATALDAQQVSWGLFSIGAVAAIAGVLMSKRQDGADARSESTLSTNRSELTESVTNIVGRLDKIINGSTDRGESLRDQIDEDLRPDLHRFAEARSSMVHLFGLQSYADIMSEFAAGERYINRVWSASADGYESEASAYLEKALTQFRNASQQLEAHTS